MTNSAKILLFILILPFLAALGHDVHLNYLSTPEKIKQVERLQFNFDEFMVSDTGWVWNKYAKNSMNMARDAISPEVWKNNLDPVLQLPTMIVGSIPFIFGLIFLGLTFVLGVWPFARQGKLRQQNIDDFAVYKHAEDKKTKFNRK